MPVVINGSTGISGNDGTAAVPTIQGTDTNTGMFFPAADQIAFAEGGVEAMRLDASGNMGIGTSSPVGRLDVRPSANSSAQIQGASHNTLTGLGAALTYSRGNDGTLNLAAVFSWNNGGLAVAGREGIAFATGGGSTYVATVERARINSGGQLFTTIDGTSSVLADYGCRAWVNFNGTGTVAIRGSGNVSSITDNNVGDYTVNFATAMPDANFSLIGNSGIANASFVTNRFAFTAPTTSAARIGVFDDTGAVQDNAWLSIQVVR